MSHNRSVVRYAVLTAIAAVFIGVPMWTMLVNSFKSAGDAANLSVALPHRWAIIENYRTVLGHGGAVRGFLNSTLITLPTVVTVLAVGTPAAWVFARGRSRTVAALYYISIVGIMLPPAIVTSVVVLKDAGVYGSYLGVVLFYTAALLSFAVFFITGFIKTIPIELEEAARIEGCRPTGIFLRVVVPLLRPILATTLIVIVLFVWSDFFFPFFLINSQNMNTLTLGLFTFISSSAYETNWNLVLADVVVVSLPLVVVYAIAQKRVVGGLMGGAINR